MTYAWAAALFLPLFPFSMLLNLMLSRLRWPAARAVLLLIWPQIGIAILFVTAPDIPAFVVPWALATSALYALRLLTVRDLGMWAGFLATSVLSLTWGLAQSGAPTENLHVFAFWFSLPAGLLALLTQPLIDRFGAAYAGLSGGLSAMLPRLSAVLVVTLLAAIATPPFPGFFAMLDLLPRLSASADIVILVIWLIWGWAATRLLQGFVAGAAQPASIDDIGRQSTWAYMGVLCVLVVVGLYLTGGGL